MTGDLAVGFDDDLSSSEEDSPHPAQIGVLVVDGERETRAFLQGVILSANRFQIKTTASGQEALEILQEAPEGKYGLVVLDLNLPDLSGELLIQKARALEQGIDIDFMVHGRQLTEEDLFLLSEFDVFCSVPKGENGKVILEKICAIDDERRRLFELRRSLRIFQGALRQEDPERCEELLTRNPRLVEEIRSNPRYQHCIGEYHIIRGEFTDAIENMQTLLRKQESGSAGTLKLLATLGRALCLSGRFDDALVIFERLAAKSPRNLNHAVACGDALVQLERTQEAMQYYQKTLDNDSTQEGALLGMGKALVVEGDMVSAQAFFEKVDGSFRSYTLASFFNNRGVALSRAGRTGEAIQFYLRALQFMEEYRPHIYFNLGLAHFKAGQYDLASGYFQKVIGHGHVPFLSKKQLLARLQEKGTEEFLSYAGGHFPHKRKLRSA